MAVDSSTDRVVPERRNTSTRSSNNDVFDLGKFMEHYHQVRDQVWPLGRLIVEIQKIRRWENYSISFIVTITLSILLLYPRALISFITGVFFIFIIIGNHYVLGSFLGNTEKRKTIQTPGLINTDAEEMERVSKEERKRQRLLKEYRKIVQKADSAVVELGHLIDLIKSIYMWEDIKLSTNVCFFLFVVSLSMLWISVSTLLSILSVLFFCLNHNFITKTKSIFLNVSSYFPQLRISKQVSQVTSNQMRTENRSVSSSQARPLSVSEELTSSGEVNERTTKKDKGNCYKCGAAFTLLKRKHQCNNCGQVFCASCTVKVTRAELGATSPAAFQQTVKVCNDCKDELDRRNNSTEQPTTTSNAQTIVN